MILRLLLIALIYLPASPAFGEDWAELFRNLDSKDPKVSEAAIHRLVTVINPELQGESADALDNDVRQIAALEEGQNDRFRVQASSLLVAICFSRTDRNVGLKSAVPIMIKHLQDTNDRVRQNSAVVLSHLGPSVPSEAVQPLIQALQDPYPLVRAAAFVGVARLAKSSPEAREAAVKLFSSEQDAAVKHDALLAIGDAGFDDPRLIQRASELLQDSDKNVVQAALTAMARLGPKALNVPGTEQRVRAIADDKTDRILSSQAQSVLEKLHAR